MTIITSFYTSDWKYPEFAKKLSKNCEDLELKYNIVEKKSNNDYLKNCNIKPFFIRETLNKFKSPILWMDVDGSIVSRPDLLFTDEILNYDIAANRGRSNLEKIHVGSIWFNYTEITLAFINDWCKKVLDGGIDDGQFNSVWNTYKNTMRFYELPQNYFVILKSLNAIPPEHSCIIHRISKSSLKQTYKKQLSKKKHNK